MTGEPLVNKFKIPEWAGKPPSGLHLDVMKDAKLVQKLMIDEKKCYFFGRNRQLCDFSVDHQSCSRVHAALVWHKNMGRTFLIDLNSVHGTFIGRIRMEPNRPQQVPIDSEIHFGASTRIFIIRERPNLIYSLGNSEVKDGQTNEQNFNGVMSTDNGGNAFLANLYNSLPRNEVELDNLTQFNTAHNRRITNMKDMPTSKHNRPLHARRRPYNVNFNDADEVINPEDVDPSVGRFRNLVQEVFIPNKQGKDSHEGADLGISAPKQSPSLPISKSLLTVGKQNVGNIVNVSSNPGFSLAAKLGLPMPNLAPEVIDKPQKASLPASISRLHVKLNWRPVKDENNDTMTSDDILSGSSELVGSKRVSMSDLEDSKLPRKKKYAKEAWPGKRPSFIVGPIA